MNPRLLFAAVLFAALASAQTTEADRTLYTIGTNVGKELVPFELTAREKVWVEHGLLDAATGKAGGLATQAQIDQLLGRRKRKLNEAFVAKAARQPGAKRYPKGYVLTETHSGEGASPTASDAVMLSFQGTLIDGTIFESTFKRGGPAMFRLDQVVPCWTEALQQMKVGGKYHLVCPAELGYGDQGFTPLVPVTAVLIFDMELVDVLRRKAIPDAGDDDERLTPSSLPTLPSRAGGNGPAPK